MEIQAERKVRAIYFELWYPYKICDHVLTESEANGDSDNHEKALPINSVSVRSLCVPVKIDHGQVLKVIIRDLRSKRKYCADTKKWEEVEYFDFVLKYYLGEEDFEKYVTEWADIDP